jgi:hypothetical protein
MNSMGIKLGCRNCGYVWITKSNHIPSRCPHCQNFIFGTTNYIDYSKNPEEKDYSLLYFIIFLTILIILFAYLHAIGLTP